MVVPLTARANPQALFWEAAVAPGLTPDPTRVVRPLLTTTVYVEATAVGAEPEPAPTFTALPVPTVTVQTDEEQGRLTVVVDA